MRHVSAALQKHVNITIITRPATDYKNGITLQEQFAAMESTGAQIIFKSGIHQKFAIMDRQIVWYGSINLLGYGRSEETLMRLESAGIAGELMKSIKS